MKYIVTWQPEIADTGAYFLTIVDAGDLELTVGQIMEIAHGVEELEVAPYDLCSIIKATDPEVVW
jgi:hypothetical protein